MTSKNNFLISHLINYISYFSKTPTIARNILAITLRNWWPLNLCNCHDHSQFWFNTYRPRRSRRRFADDIFQWIYLNENLWISIDISLKCVLKGQIDNIRELVWILAWRRLVDKPLFVLCLAFWRIYASLGLDELTKINTTLADAVSGLFAAMECIRSCL